MLTTANEGDRAGFPEEAFAYYERLERVRQYVDQHLSETILLADVARIARLERKYFSAFFRRVVGVCFRDWLTEYRIHRAIELLRSRDESISRIADAVGFQNLRSFQRAFRRSTRLSASSFRATVRESILSGRPGQETINDSTYRAYGIGLPDLTGEQKR